MALKFNREALYQLPKTYLNFRLAGSLILTDLSIGIFGYMFIEGYSFVEALYMTILTISTVGYEEVQPLSTTGQIFTTAFIVFNFAIISYIAAVISYYVFQGQIFKDMHLSMIKRDIDKLHNHVILCGYGRYGKQVAKHLMDKNEDFVVVDIADQVVEGLAESEIHYLYAQGDATDEATLKYAGIMNAKVLIAACPLDVDNVFIVLTARQMNPKLQIISRVRDQKSMSKLKMAGANHVIMPELVGGYFMAALVNRPVATDFFNYMATSENDPVRFEEIKFEQLPDEMKGKSIGDLKFLTHYRVNIIGVRDSGGHYVLNPGTDFVLSEGASFVTLGNRKQMKLLLQTIGRVE